ncbi:hypothetical protein RSO41_04515, partial [Halomonas sp. I1]|uniref:hypothetical protein n=1 Tax=Halomonas sp. I1 TaxID=393536 RepID=UPI0028E09A5E
MASQQLDNPRFTIYDADGYSVDSALGNNGQGPAEISFVAESSGIYSVGAHELGDDDVGDYELKVDVSPVFASLNNAEVSGEPLRMGDLLVDDSDQRIFDEGSSVVSQSQETGGSVNLVPRHEIDVDDFTLSSI